MWNKTPVAQLLKSTYPILQGPFGAGLSSVELVAAVSNLGGVGGYGAYTMTPEEILKVDEQIKKATKKPCNINLWVNDTDVPSGGIDSLQVQKVLKLFEPYAEELNIAIPNPAMNFTSRFENQVEVILHTKPTVFSFVFGIPSKTILDQCKKLGIITMGCATTLDEAITLEAAEVDLIVASGFEAGGHRPSFLASSESSLTGTFVLIQQIKEKVRTPIIAAGGIASGKGIAAALTLGADGVQIGTAFLACEESNALSMHREMLFSEQAKYTALTRAFTGRLGRGLRSKITMEIQGKEEQLLPFPLQTQFMSSLRQAAATQQKWEMVLFWGGQIAPLLKHRKAKDLMKALIEDTGFLFSREG